MKSRYHLIYEREGDRTLSDEKLVSFFHILERLNFINLIRKPLAELQAAKLKVVNKSTDADRNTGWILSTFKSVYGYRTFGYLQECC